MRKGQVKMNKQRVFSLKENLFKKVPIGMRNTKEEKENANY